MISVENTDYSDFFLSSKQLFPYDKQVENTIQRKSEWCV